MTYPYRLSIIPAGAVIDLSLKAGDIRVLALLGRHTDNSGWCRRSQVKMAAELHCSRGAVQQALERLYEAGWVEKRAEGRGTVGPDPDKQPFASHSYRVKLDRDEATAESITIDDDAPDGPEQGGATLLAPQGGASQLAPGATPEVARGATPGVAPLEEDSSELSPCEPDQRESAGAREAGKKDSRSKLAALIKSWPTGAVDDQARIERAWDALPDSEQDAAINGVAPFLEALKKFKRTGVPALWKYLDERRWRLMPDANPVAQPKHVDVPCWSREWWAIIFDRLNRRETVSFLLHHAVQSGSRIYPCPIEKMPAPETVSSFTSYPSDGHVMAAWRPWFEARGVRLPDWQKQQWVFLPSAAPPGSRSATDPPADRSTQQAARH